MIKYTVAIVLGFVVGFGFCHQMEMKQGLAKAQKVANVVQETIRQ